MFNGKKLIYIAFKLTSLFVLTLFTPLLAAENKLSEGMPIKWQVNVVKRTFDISGKASGNSAVNEYRQTDINQILGNQLRFEPLSIECELSFESGVNSWEKMGLKSRAGETSWYREELNFFCKIDKKIIIKATHGVYCRQNIGKNSEIFSDENHIDIEIANKGYFAVHAFCGSK